jgi:hypothetical protein
MVIAPAPQQDWFAGLGENEALALDWLAVDEVAQLKLHHLFVSSPYRVLLLGNSIPLPVGGQDIGLPQGHMFNLALSGESLRSSIALLEHLARQGKLPRLALISFDHAENQYYSNPLWPKTGERWSMMARDLMAGMRRTDISCSELLRMLRRHVLTEIEILSRLSAFERIARGARIWWGRLWGRDERKPFLASKGYLADGRRPSAQVTKPFVATAPMPVPNRNVLPGYLNYDLERLDALVAAGTRIVIFETVLAPSLHGEAMAHPSTVAAETRSTLLSLCVRHKVECHAAPASYNDEGLPWPDPVHAPVPVLVQLIAPWVGEGMTAP